LLTFKKMSLSPPTQPKHNINTDLVIPNLEESDKESSTVFIENQEQMKAIKTRNWSSYKGRNVENRFDISRNGSS